MSHTVAKPFNTATQRFKVGSVVNDGDDLVPHTIDSLKAGGFVTVVQAAPANPSPAARSAKPGED